MNEPRTAATVTDTEAYHEGPPPPSKVMEICVAGAGMVFMAVVLVLARDIELRREVTPGQIGARFWPTMLAGTGLVVAAWRLLIVLLRPADARPDLERVQRKGPVRLLLTLALAIAFVAVWNLREVELAGYELRAFPYACAALLAALAWLYGGRGWKALLLFPVVTTAVAYLLFGVLLRIPL